jgi:hypothetical protein
MHEREHTKKRGGILGWVLAHPVLATLLCIALMSAAMLWLLDFRAEQELDRVLAGIRESGAPVTLEDLRALTACDIPDEENMGVQLTKHAEGLAKFIELPPEHQRSLPYVDRGRLPPNGQRLPQATLDAAQWYLEARAEALAGTHKALLLDSGCIHREWKQPVIETSMSGLSSLRHCAKVLALEGRLAAETGDSTRALGNATTTLRIDRVLESGGTLIDMLVRTAVRTLAMDQIERTINLCGLSEHQLSEFETALAEGRGSIGFRESLLFERVIIMETIEWELARGGGDPDANPAIGSWIGLVPVLKDLGTRKSLEAFQGLIDAVGQPDSATIKRFSAASQKTAALPKYCMLWSMLMPSYERACELWVRSEGMDRAMQAAIACERYRLATGAWPESLDALVPGYLDAVPLDPFDGKPIRHLRTEEGIKVYTIGEDGKDDGGDIKRMIPPKNKQDRATDHGWLLLNPDMRGRPADEPDSDEGESPDATDQS